MEFLVLALFCILLILCIALDISILIALLIGLGLFVGYALYKGFRLKVILQMCLDGALTSKNIILTMVLIGMLTASWRASGTIVTIVCDAQALMQPSAFLLIAFLLNGLVSFLTGSSFATAATMGVICATMGSTLHVSPALYGGAILSGCYVGDRCSPISTSALLVAQLTNTDIFTNIRAMLRTALVPFLATCALTLALGRFLSAEGDTPDLTTLFSSEYHLHWVALLPALLILVLALFRVNVKLTMISSILIAMPICLFLQEVAVGELLQSLFFGYSAHSEAVGAMMNGGGILSMVRVICIITLSSSYSGIFRETGLLTPLQELIEKLAMRISAYGAILVTSILTSAMACNQTLATILTAQLHDPIHRDSQRLAIDLEDSVILVAGLIPWSIAGAIPLATIDAPTTSLLAASYLYLIPLWRLFGAVREKP